ncbi:hypothetical protein Nepgr_032811 [Nepenthes gracilis]|uniref:HIT domain-containing protein n=1 Tax=Nepenthes gracilis TaxID=150966 RepID=A0AAD3TL47_NEPGR|nr:hypothetical protein Nepgr_032811 [Nepenthes gracilis]
MGYMEAAPHRLAVLCSHFHPICSADSVYTTTPLNRFSCSSASNCSSIVINEHRTRDSENAILEDDCVFCKIIRGDSPAYKLYEDEKCLCILDASPLSCGHCLLIPKFHFSSLDVTPPSVLAAMCSKIPFIGNAIMKATGCDSFNLLVNNGAAAGQVIFHTHLHIIPRKACDRLWDSESLRRLSLQFNKETSQLVERIRHQLSFSSNTEEMKSHGSPLAGN